MVLEKMSYSVYWLHLEKHTDIFSEGYIGITDDAKRRLQEHRKRPERRNLIYTTLIVGAKHYCREVEFKLRLLPGIGLNVAQGGGGGGFAQRKHTEEWKKASGERTVKRQGWQYAADAVRGKSQSEEQKRKRGLYDQSGEKNAMWGKPGPRLGKKNSPEANEKNRLAHLGKNAWNKGKKIGPIGMVWFTNGINNLKLKVDASIPEGYQKGRTMHKKRGA